MITWVEDTQRYVQDMIDELESIGYLVDVIKDANSLVQRLPQIVKETYLIILDLWLPVGKGDGVPLELCNKDRNTHRGLWLYELVSDALSETGREIPILVLSGNLDVDTQKQLLSLGIKKEHMLKKPVEFDTFISLAQKLAEHGSKSSKPDTDCAVQ